MARHFETTPGVIDTLLNHRFLYVSIGVCVGQVLLAFSLASQWRTNLNTTALYIWAQDVSATAASSPRIVVDVYVDNKPVRRSVSGADIPVVLIKPGRHAIEIRAAGYKPYSQTMSAAADGGEAYIYAMMHPR